MLTASKEEYIVALLDIKIIDANSEKYVNIKIWYSEERRCKISAPYLADWYAKNRITDLVRCHSRGCGALLWDTWSSGGLWEVAAVTGRRWRRSTRSQRESFARNIPITCRWLLRRSIWAFPRDGSPNWSQKDGTRLAALGPTSALARHTRGSTRNV